MKKGIIGVLYIIISAAFLSAGDVGASLQTTLDIEASNTIGYNIQNNVFGMQTALDKFRLQFKFTDWQNIESDLPLKNIPYSYVAAEGFDWYLYTDRTLDNINEKDWTENGTTDYGMGHKNLEAKIVLNPFWFGIMMGYPQRQMEAGNSSIFRRNDADPTSMTDNLLSLEVTDDAGIVYFGYNDKLIDVTVKFGSESDWEAINQGGFSFGLETEIRPMDNLTVNATAIGLYRNSEYDYESLGPIAFGVSSKYSHKLPLFDVEPYIGFDGQLNTDDSFNYEIGGGISLAWGEYKWSWDDLQEGDGNLYPGVTLAGNYSDSGTGNISVSFYEPSGDEGILPIVGLTGAFDVKDFNGDSEYGLDLWVDTLLVNDNIKPFARMKYHEIGTTEESFSIDAGTDFLYIENALFRIQYETTNLTNITENKGSLTFKTVIFY